MASSSSIHTWNRAAKVFVREVRIRCADNGNRAAVRRSRSRAQHRVDPEAMKVIEAAMAAAEEAAEDSDWPLHRNGDSWAFACYTIAAMVAEEEHLSRSTSATGTDSGLKTDEATDTTREHPQATPEDADTTDNKQRRPRSVTATLGYAVSRGELNEDTTTSRLHSMVRGHRAALGRQLPGLADRLIVARHTPDWPGLLVDLVRWDDHRPEIATRWLRSYHRALLSTDAPDPDPGPLPKDSDEESDPQ